MTTATERLLLASIHDVSPRFESAVDGLTDLLRAHVGERIALLVVPNHWGDAPILPSSPFAARLRQWAQSGFEIFLHGFFHRDEARHDRASDRLRTRVMTAGEGEFLGLTCSVAAARIQEGRSLIEGITGCPIAGFVAPAWLYGPGALQALSACSIAIAEDHMRVWSPISGRTLAGGPVITWASRTPMRLASSLAAAAALRHAPLKVLRIGVHPPDVRHPALLRSIEKTFRRAARTRRASAYGELLSG
ncbi:MAG: polysaccharide deacetylase family protein [Sphingomicrobium sp.]